MITAGFEFAFGVFIFIVILYFIYIFISPIDEFDQNSPSIFSIIINIFFKYIVPYIILFFLGLYFTQKLEFSIVVGPIFLIYWFYKYIYRKRKINK